MLPLGLGYNKLSVDLTVRPLCVRSQKICLTHLYIFKSLSWSACQARHELALAILLPVSHPRFQHPTLEPYTERRCRTYMSHPLIREPRCWFKPYESPPLTPRHIRVLRHMGALGREARQFRPLWHLGTNTPIHHHPSKTAAAEILIHDS